MADSPGKHHYAAQSYLKRWSVDETRVRTYRTVVHHERMELWKQPSLRGIACLQHLYVYRVNGQLTDAFERWLGKHIDSPSSVLLDKVAAEQPLSPEDATGLLKFFAASRARTPSHLARRMFQWQREPGAGMQAEIERRVAEAVGEQIANAPERLPTPPAGLDYPIRTSIRMHEDGRRLVIRAKWFAGGRSWLNEIVNDVHEAPTALCPESWGVYRTPPGRELLTSDDPAVVASVSMSNAITLGGFQPNEPGVAFIPLGPHHVLLLNTLMVPGPQYAELTPEMTDFLNMCTVKNAGRYIFARGVANWVQELRPREVDPERLQRDVRHFERWKQGQYDADELLDDDDFWPRGEQPAGP